jgi:hypothetical protein
VEKRGGDFDVLVGREVDGGGLLVLNYLYYIKAPNLNETILLPVVQTHHYT